MKKYVLILAGGEGHRAGGGMPKQFREICGHPVVWWSMHAFYEADRNTRIIAVVHPGFLEDWEMYWRDVKGEDYIPHELCCGGRTRAESVKNGLMMIDGEPDSFVAIHDAARPLVTPAIINEGWRRISDSPDFGIAPCSPVVDSMREFVGSDRSLVDTRSVVRADFVNVSTPQIFTYGNIFRAYAPYDYEQVKEGKGVPGMSDCTDDLSFGELSGLKVMLYHASDNNMKVTNPEDFAIAETILRLRNGR